MTSVKDNIAIIDSAEHSLIVVGHTLQKFLPDILARQALERALLRRVHVTLMLQNPRSRFVDAHSYERILARAHTPSEEVNASLQTLRNWLKAQDEVFRNLRVVLTNHLPTHRAIIVDNRVCYMGIYLFARDVSANPVLRFDNAGSASEREWYQAISQAISDQIAAPDSIEIVREGVYDDLWHQRHIADFDQWDIELKRRYILTWNFYRKEALEFSTRYEWLLENYVKAYLENYRGRRRVLVVGCGSGKEIRHLIDLGCERVVGWDFSQMMIERAGQKLADLGEGISLRVENFYDMDLDRSAPYDGIVANAALVHLPNAEDLKKILKGFFDHLQPDGLCFIRVLNKNGTNCEEEAEGNRFGSPRWFTYFSGTTLRQMAEEIGFVIDKLADVSAAEVVNGDRELLANQGFKHAEFKEVFWPTVLLRKPANGSRHEPVSDGASTATIVTSDFEDPVLFMQRQNLFFACHHIVAGRYVRYSQKDVQQLKSEAGRITDACKNPSRAQENFFVWGHPGEGKTFFVSEVAKQSGVHYREINLNDSGIVPDAGTLSNMLNQTLAGKGGVLCALDEIDKRTDASEWLYPSIFTFLDRNTTKTNPDDPNKVFVLIGSKQPNFDAFRNEILKRNAGRDLFRRVVHREILIPPLTLGDRMVTALNMIWGFRAEERIVQASSIALAHLLINYSTNAAIAQATLKSLARVKDHETSFTEDHLNLSVAEWRGFCQRYPSADQSLMDRFVQLHA